MRFAWEQFAAGEKIPGSVRGPIAASWRRCRRRGLDPHQRPSVERLVGEELEEHCRQTQPIARIGQPFMEKIGRYTVPNSLVFLADAEGYIVMIEGETGPCRSHPLFPGGNLLGRKPRDQCRRPGDAGTAELPGGGAEHYTKSTIPRLRCSPHLQPRRNSCRPGRVTSVCRPSPYPGHGCGGGGSGGNQLGLERL